MIARAARTQHPDVHGWAEWTPGEWQDSVISLCGGIEAEESYLDETSAPIDCRGCIREVDEDHDAALARERTYEFRRKR